MTQNKFAVLLSPPNSPRMSNESRGNDYDSQSRLQSRSSNSSLLHKPGQDGRAMSMGGNTNHYPLRHPQLLGRTYTNSPYAALPSTQAQQYAGSTSGLAATWNERSALGYDSSATTYKEPAMDSPNDRLTPRSTESCSNQEPDDDDLVESGGDDQDESDEKGLMTAADRRAAKRKMKRFRLTHSQTRFLMSEFARQAHPDAAHRDRLAQEIPGLSARQVQVWFQNRRAKLKRLTSDDRERMMRSRALPADFDTTQALHSPFGVQAPTITYQTPTMGSFGTYGDHSGGRSLTLDTFRRPEYDLYSPQYGSSSGLTPTLSGFTFTPPPSTSDHLSPASGLSPYLIQHQGSYDRRQPIAMNPSSHASFPSQAQPSHHRPHGGIARTAGDSVNPLLRTSISHSALGHSHQRRPELSERAVSFSEQSSLGASRVSFHRDTGNDSVTESASYDLGLSYPHYSAYPPSGQRREALPETSYSELTTSGFHTAQMAPFPAYDNQYSSPPMHGGYQQPPIEHQQPIQDRSSSYRAVSVTLPQYMPTSY